MQLKREHLAECPHCAAKLEALEQFLAGSEIPANGRLGNTPPVQVLTWTTMGSLADPSTWLEAAPLMRHLHRLAALPQTTTARIGGLTLTITGPSAKTREAAYASFLNSRNLSTPMK